MSWWRLKLVMWLMKGGGWGICANRWWSTRSCGPYEIKLLIRDTRKPDGYERTELFGMLRAVREHEAEQDWKVPEAANEGAQAIGQDTLGVSQ